MHARADRGARLAGLLRTTSQIRSLREILVRVRSAERFPFRQAVAFAGRTAFARPARFATLSFPLLIFGRIVHVLAQQSDPEAPTSPSSASVRLSPQGRVA